MKVTTEITKFHLDGEDKVTIQFSLFNPKCNDGEGGYEFGELVLHHNKVDLLIEVDSNRSLGSFSFGRRVKVVRKDKVKR